MFKRKVEDSGKNTMFQFAFKIFFVHIVNIIVMLVVGMLLQSIGDLGLVISGTTMSAIITIICMALYLVMIYLEGWRRGERDHNQVLFKHMEYNKFRGLIAGALSQIPGIVCAVAILFPSVDFTIERLGRYFYMNFNYMFVALDSMSAAGTVSAFVYHLCYFIPALIAPIVVGIAYHLGYRQIRVLDRLMWKKNSGKRENLR